MKSRFVFLDVDGTILPFGAPLPESAREALIRADEHGHKLFLSTGRSRFELAPVLSELPFTGGVLGAGALCYADGWKIVKEMDFDEDFRKEVVDYFISEDIGVYAQMEESTYVNKNKSALLAQLFDRYIGGPLDIPHAFETDDLQALKKVTKFFFYSDKPCLDGVMEHFGSRAIVIPNTVGLPPELCGEMQIRGVDKSFGMRAILENAGIGGYDCVAIGDGANDIEMVRDADVGIAMGNAIPALKEIADYVSTDINSDGLYNAFRWAGLI